MSNGNYFDKEIDGSLIADQTQTGPNRCPSDGKLEVSSVFTLHQSNRRHLATQRSNGVEVESGQAMVNTNHELIRAIADSGQKPQKPWLNTQ